MIKQNILIALLLTVCFLKPSEHEEQSKRLSISNLRLNYDFILKQVDIPELEMQKLRNDTGKKYVLSYPVGKIVRHMKPSEWAEREKRLSKEVYGLEIEKDFQPKK